MTQAADGPVWRGAVIAEGLEDPTVINQLRVVRAHVTRDGLPVDGQPGGGRWHMYWVDVTPGQLDLLQAQTKHGWYAHFWVGTQLLVIYDDARFELARHDPSTWQPAISHGLGQGLRSEWLDFPTDETVGDLQ